MHTLREILNVIFYIVRSVCAWRLLPHGFPPWKTIRHYFRTWRIATAPGKGCTLPCAGGRVDSEKLLPPPGFRVLPKLWIVECAFSWTDQNRRLRARITKG